MTTLAAMQEPTDTPVDDAMLDTFEADLDRVSDALESLDADDLDRAESLAAGLEDLAPGDGVAASTDAPVPTETVSSPGSPTPPGYE